MEASVADDRPIEPPPASFAYDRRVALRLLGLVRPHIGRLALAALCVLASSVAFLLLPYAVRQLTDGVFVHHDAAALDHIALMLLAVVLAAAAFGYFRGYLVSYVGTRIVTDLRVRLYAHLQGLSISFYDDHRTGDLMSRVGNDVTLVQNVLTEGLLSLLQQTVTLIAVVVIVLLLDWRLALLTLVLAPFMALSGVLVGRYMRRLSKQAQEQLGEATVVVEETLSAIRVVKAFSREGYELERYRTAVERSFRTGLSAARLRSLLGAGIFTTFMASTIGVLWFGGHEVLAGRLTPGSLISFLLYLGFLVGPIQALASLAGEFQTAAGGSARIFEILDTQPAVVDTPDASLLPPVEGYVEMRDVRFRYGPDLPEVLRGVSLQVRPGETVALVGPSGAGKTTLVSLLLRFYDPTGGTILMDGHDIGRVTVESLRAGMAIVPQEATLFGGTIRENIAYGKVGASEAEIEQAAILANAHAFITALPQGYDSVVGERGVKLSGGQRQRIAIARAILKDPRLLLLDEATSSLDNESEALVQEALDRLMAGRTTIVIAHRLTTVENADRIVVLDEGRVVEEGTHRELMRREGLYYRLYTRSFETEDALPA